MAFVQVNLLVEGKSFTVDVDEYSAPTKLAKGFAKKPGLSGSDYRIALVGALKIAEGVTLRLEKTEDEELFNNLVPNMGEFKQAWNISAGKSWMKRYFQTITA